LASLKARFAARGTMLTPNNARQARVPEGAEVVSNPVGSAPMFIQKIGRCTFFYVPGVPREYRALVDREVLPRLEAMIAAQPQRIYRAARLLKTVGLPESHLDAKVAPLAAAHPYVRFGFRTHAPENHLKLLAEAPSAEEARRALAAAESASRQILEPHLFGADEETFAEVVARLLRESAQTVALAESCTGGGVCAQLTAVPGASTVFRGGAVTYHEDSKQAWAGVRKQTLEKFSPVSAEVTVEMAEGIRQARGSSFGLAVTGYAGPEGGTAQDPIGAVYCALARPDGTSWERHLISGPRERVQLFASAYTLDLLRRTLMISKGGA
jgi:nicotinamide-nucleotide amidase